MGGDLKNGNKGMCVKQFDKSMVPPKGSVNTDALRSGVAASPKTVGPRTA